MGKIEGRRSKYVYDRRAYKRSWRAKRRKHFAKVRDSVRVSAPPPIFGRITDILVVLAKSGPVRRVALYEMFSEMRVGSLAKSDVAGITTGWQLPGSDKRGQRGAGVALNPQFPLAKEVRALLLALGKDFPFTATCDMAPAEQKIPKRKRTYALEKMFISKLRLRVLQAIDILGGDIKMGILENAIPGMRWIVVRDTVDQLVRDGVVKRAGSNVRLVEAPWTKPLRSLLRVYRKKVEPKLTQEINDQKRWARSVRSKGIFVTLFGRNATERALKILAVDGPLTNAELELGTLPQHKPPVLETLIRSGILTRQLVPKKYPERNDHYVVGLNAAHPIYKELRMLLAAMADAKPSRKPALSEWREHYSLKGLFMTRQRLQSLIAIGLATHRYIHPSSIRRLYPRLHLGGMGEMLRKWALNPKGYVRRLDSKIPAYYELNPDYPYHEPLRALLVRIGQVWPEYSIGAGLEDSLSPRSHRGTRALDKRVKSAKQQMVAR